MIGGIFAGIKAAFCPLDPMEARAEITKRAAYRQFQQEKNQMTTLRKLIGQAIFDPGAVVGFKGERSLSTWQLDAVMAVLADEAPTVAQGVAFPVGKGQGDKGAPCAHVRITSGKDPADYDAYLECADCGRTFSSDAALSAARREGKAGADPQPEASTGARATGWLIHKNGQGWYRAEAMGYTSDPAQAGRFSREEAESHSHPNGWDGPRDGITIKHESELFADPLQIQGGWKILPNHSREGDQRDNLGEPKRPEPLFAFRDIVEASEVYAAGRTEQVTVRHSIDAPQFYYDAAQLRAAFRAGYDYARAGKE